jgi:hypothetical protein
MTGSAKQSIARHSELDCFVASAFLLRSPSFGGRGRSLSYGGQVAPRNDVDATPHSRGARRPSFCKNRSPRKERGRRECRVPAAPEASRAKLSEAHEHSHHRFRRIHPGIPRAMVLRLIPCSPRRRIRLVTVIRGLRTCLRPVGPTRLRELDTSNGCQNHTALPSASASLVCVPLIAHGKPALRSPLTLNAAASTASRSQRP